MCLLIATMVNVYNQLEKKGERERVGAGGRHSDFTWCDSGLSTEHSVILTDFYLGYMSTQVLEYHSTFTNANTTRHVWLNLHQKLFEARPE